MMMFDVVSVSMNDDAFLYVSGDEKSTDCYCLATSSASR